MLTCQFWWCTLYMYEHVYKYSLTMCKVNSQSRIFDEDLHRGIHPNRYRAKLNCLKNQQPSLTSDQFYFPPATFLIYLSWNERPLVERGKRPVKSWPTMLIKLCSTTTWSRFCHDISFLLINMVTYRRQQGYNIQVTMDVLIISGRNNEWQTHVFKTVASILPQRC